MGEAIRVLHVEDDPEFSDLTAIFLEREEGRFSIDTAADAAEGHELLDDREYDCIVSDYDMPGANGIEFLRAVREAYPELPFVLFTGKGSEEVASEAISAGVTDYLQKESGSESFELLANRIENTVSQYRAQKHAAETEQRLLELSEATNDVLWIFSADWDKLHFVNSAYEKIWGRSAEQLRENPADFLNGIHPEDRNRVRTAMERLSNGQSIDVEYRVNPETEYSRWVWAQGVPILEDGRVVRIAGFSRDVTEHKRHENRLREEREFVEKALDALNDTFYVVDTNGDLIRWNDQLPATTGYSEAEIAEMAPAEFFPPEQRDRIERAIDEIYDTDEVIVEAELLTAEGDRIPFEFTGVKLTNTDDETIGFAGVGRNIAERTERERELELYETVVNTIDDVVFVVNEDRNVELVNEPLVQYAASAPDGVQGASISELTERFAASEAEASQFERELDAAFEADAPAETTRTVEVELSIPAGQFVVEYQLSPFAADGERRVAVIARDVTDRTERERELERTNERLEEFASIVSHDLRNPLNVAELRLELARAERDSEHLATVDRSLDRMSTMIEDLLMLARSGETVHETEPIALDTVARACWDRLDTGEASLVVADPREIEANGSTLQQLLENLVQNSVEHGGEGVTVEIGPCEGGFYVADDGPGVPEEQREEIFETGYTTDQNGLGMGLSIVQQIVDAHGWEIAATESDAGGARFEITGVDRAEQAAE
jgi:PAS domain S-box-containing protein